MKKFINTFLLVLTIGLVSNTSLSAQKYGYTNLGNLIEQLPKAKSANETLKVFQEQKAKQYEAKVAAFQKEYQEFATIAQSGGKTQKQIQEFEVMAQQKQQEFAQLEQQAQTEVMQKRQELLDPMLKQIEDAIEAVAKENGYQFIFDASVFNFLLYVDESEDVTSLVLKKLGL